MNKMDKNADLDRNNYGLKCLICKSSNVRNIHSNYPGYVLDTYYNIMNCDNCCTQFILAPSTPEELYNTIYRLECVSGYNRYKKYAKNTLLENEPLKYLSKQEFPYYAVFKYLENRKEKVKSILEVGTGLGYLTYALNKSGYITLGIDVSEVSVKSATDLFGPYYMAISLEKLNKLIPQKFDLIIMTEVIEHVEDPHKLIRECLPLLNENGTVLLTTPYYYDISKIWETDLPPVHRFWFSKLSFTSIAQDLGLNINFIFPDRVYFDSSDSNLVIAYLMNKFLETHKQPKSILTGDLSDCAGKKNREGMLKNVANKFVNLRLAKYFSNKFYIKFIHEPSKSFAVILNNNKSKHLSTNDVHHAYDKHDDQ